MDAEGFGFIEYVECHHNGNAHVKQLNCEVEVSFKIGGVHHVDHNVGPFAHDEVARYGLVQRLRA